MKISRHILVAAFVLTIALTVSAANAGRIVAVGDVHGNFDGLTSILQETGIIDADLKWTGGTATYVQLGDLFDRGLHVREILDFLIRLQGEAKTVGGRVECILGNHEIMNLTGFYRDNNPEVYSTFVDSKSEKRRKKLWSNIKSYRGLTGEPTDDAAREAWMVEHPLGWVEYAQALAPNGVYGKWLRTLPVAMMIDGSLFIHGGLSPQVAGMSVAEINAAVESEIKTFDTARRYLVSKSILAPTASVAPSDGRYNRWKAESPESSRACSPSADPASPTFACAGNSQKHIAGVTVTERAHDESNVVVTTCDRAMTNSPAACSVSISGSAMFEPISRKNRSLSSQKTRTTSD